MKTTFLALLAVLSVGLTACGGETADAAAKSTPAVIMKMAGDGTKASTPFNAPRTWTLSYTYDCSSLGFRGNVQVYLYRDAELVRAPINELGTGGEGSTTIYETGQGFHIEVSTYGCTWAVKATA